MDSENQSLPLYACVAKAMQSPPYHCVTTALSTHVCLVSLQGYISPPRAPQRDNSERLHDEDMDLSDDTPTSMYEEPPYDDGPMQTEPQPPHDDYPGYHGAPPPLPPPPPLHGAHGALPPWHQHSAPPLPQVRELYT